MANRVCTVAVLLLLAPVAAAEVIYKHRAPDGSVTYSSRPIPGAERIETPDSTYTAPAQGSPASGAAVDRRISAQIAARDKAWNELQDANRALALAEKLLREGVAPVLDDPDSLSRPELVVPLPDMSGKTDAEKAAIVTAATEKAQSDSQAIGGPQRSASPAVGGRLPGASASVGGSMARLGGGGRNQDYLNRMALLETNVVVARARVDTAQRTYNQLR
jgi:hypothetical protein